MRIVIAPDSFKECLEAPAVAQAIARGWRRVFPEVETVLVPMADGGEGTVEALVAATGGSKIEAAVTGPMGHAVTAVYGILGGGRTAVIEMAAASGLPLVPISARDPRLATTRGTGELMRDALDRGLRRIILGIGGSATNDGGAGMAQALGFSLLDAAGAELPPGGAALAHLCQIDDAKKHPGLEGAEILVACDVQNPLCGPSGASRVYGPQKGAGEAAAAELDQALRHFAAVVKAALGADVLAMPGAGAAGGLGAGLAAFAGARLCRGAEVVADACALRERIAGADLVITGEGRLDAQTAHGKTPAAVARIAKAAGVPVVAIAGTLAEDYAALQAMGIDAILSICPGPAELREAMARAGEWIENTAETLARLWRLAGRARGV